MGLLLQEMDLMVKTTMANEREVDDTRSIKDEGVKDKMRECNILILVLYNPKEKKKKN